MPKICGFNHSRPQQPLIRYIESTWTKEESLLKSSSLPLKYVKDHRVWSYLALARTMPRPESRSRAIEPPLPHGILLMVLAVPPPPKLEEAAAAACRGQAVSSHSLQRANTSLEQGRPDRFHTRVTTSHPGAGKGVCLRCTLVEWTAAWPHRPAAWITLGRQTRYVSAATSWLIIYNGLLNSGV